MYLRTRLFLQSSLLVTFLAFLPPYPTPHSSINVKENEMAPTLFTPIKVGNCELAHRVAMAPLTRFRADKAHVHGDLAVEYYAQRGSTPGTLLVTEATFISPEAGGYDNVHGIWKDAQVAAWKKVRAAIHANACRRRSTCC